MKDEALFSILCVNTENQKFDRVVGADSVQNFHSFKAQYTRNPKITQGRRGAQYLGYQQATDTVPQLSGLKMENPKIDSIVGANSS